MRTICSRVAAVTAVAALFAFSAGCSRSKAAKDVAAMNTQNIQRVANLYSAFQNYKGGRGPNDEAEFKAFVKEFDPNKLSMMGIDANSADAIFVSERDGQPFKIRYKVGGGRGSVDPVAFEAAGAGGTKRVAYTGGKVDEVDDATYAQLWSGKGGASPPSGPPQGRPSDRPAGAPTGP